MQGRLSLRNGILYVGRHEQTAHVRPYDLDGGALGAGFSFRGPQGDPCTLAGLDVDEDHQVWIADGVGACVRAFSLFGKEVRRFEGRIERTADARGSLGIPTDVALLPHEDDEPSLIVASGGRRRHAVQVYRGDGGWEDSLRPEGNPLGYFQNAQSIAHHGRMTYVCEPRAGQVQVFRDGEFHFLFRVPTSGGAVFEPRAVAPLDDGRVIIAAGGDESALLLVDAAGRLIDVLAEKGSDSGQVFEPNDVVAEAGGEDEGTRLAVIDRDAERVQVFTLDGRCFGAFEELPGQVAGS